MDEIVIPLKNMKTERYLKQRAWRKTDEGRAAERKYRATYRIKHGDKLRAQKLASKDRIRHEKHRPEGTLILGPYKMPLKPVEKGFGFCGALTFDIQGRLQCHICGELHDNLGFHIRKHGKMGGQEYKEKFQLAYDTALISERQREKRKIRMAKTWAMMTADQRIARKAKSRRRWLQWKRGKQKPMSLEVKNKRGICPDQLTELIKQAAEHYKRNPSQREFCQFHQTTRFIPPIKRTYGSWNNAVKAAGFIPLSKRRTSPKGIKKNKYTNEDLLTMLHGYYEEHGVTPSASDSRRGFLPSEAVFIRRFGSFPNARKAAGLPNWDLSIKEEDNIKSIIKK